MLKILSTKCVAIVIIKHRASHIGGQQQNMRQVQIMSFVSCPQIRPFHKEIWPAGWQSTEQICEHLICLLLIITHKFVLTHCFRCFLDQFPQTVYWVPLFWGSGTKDRTVNRCAGRSKQTRWKEDNYIMWSVSKQIHGNKNTHNTSV